MSIAKPEPLQPLIVTAQPQQDPFVSFRIGAAEPLHSIRNRPASGEALGRIGWPGARGGVQTIDAFDEGGVGARVGFDEQAAHALGHALSQLPHGRRITRRLLSGRIRVFLQQVAT